MNKKLLNRVKAGAAFLNVVKPNWLKRINLKKLDLASSSVCILGEVYGDYGEATEKLGLENEMAQKLGFVETTGEGEISEEDYPQLIPKYKALTNAWKNFIKRLL